METKIQKLTEKLDNRIIAVSDIHGCVELLEGVLKKINYTSEDNLIIVGDIIEKGPRSLDTVRYILKLKEANPNVYATMGNLEYGKIGNFFDFSEQGDEAFLKGLHWSKNVWKKGFYLDMLNELGIELESLELSDIPDLKKKLLAEYREELEFLRDLPTIIMCGNYIFVHAGIDTEDEKELLANEAFKFLKIDAFMKKGLSFEKCVIVGHWPTCLYYDTESNLNPCFDYDGHIIGIDGGCALKTGAQLNALLIPNAYATMQEVGTSVYDGCPVIVADKPQKEKKADLLIRYFDSVVELIEDCGDYVRLKAVSSGTEFVAPKSYLYTSKGELHCDDFANTELEIEAGDRLSVIADTSYGTLVKKNGVIGWYMNKNQEGQVK